MILNRLTLCDFRSYRGLHEIELSPRTRYRSTRPIVLFGGLNGSGKTTLMLAIKLALYGRHALGMGTTNSNYHRFLNESVHTSPVLTNQRRDAFVEIDFDYGKLGSSSHYAIRRSWSTSRTQITEKLSVCQDGTQLQLSDKACQGFLNELVPIGVSELFFFDGEKISELADDESGSALKDAVQQLLGLHLVERLRGDLRVYILHESAISSDQAKGGEIDRTQEEYEEALRSIDVLQEELTSLEEKLETLAADHDRMDLRLSELGGEWGISRESWRAQCVSLSSALEKTKRELRDELSDIFPLTLVREALVSAFEAASNGLKNRTQADTNRILVSFANDLKNELDGAANGTIDRLLSSAVKPVPSHDSRIDVTQRAIGRMENVIQHTIPAARSRVSQLVLELESAQNELDAVTLRFEQAPDEDTLASDAENLANLAKKVRDTTVDVEVCRRELKSRYRIAIECARTLRDRHLERSAIEASKQPIEYAERSRHLLRDFRSIKSARKITEIEIEFASIFDELARKDDLVASARINPKDFTVKLLNREGKNVRKSQLSAGEKQIYAIAMLDALARTSGRRLPVVIDTPLGRLDSAHRSNLVSSYFPRASHQVILLSTDVEVDERFYRTLSRHISHTFQICYDRNEGTSRIQEGYFWRRSGTQEDG